MARLIIFLNIFFILIATATSLTEPNPKPKPKPTPKQKPPTFVIPVLKDTSSGLYYTTMTIGKPPVVVNLVVDVGGSALSFNCENIGYNSTTYTPVLCGSRDCDQPKDHCNTCYGPYGPTCRKDTCQSYTKSELMYTDFFVNVLNDDVILRYTSPSTFVARKLATRVPLVCIYSVPNMREFPSRSNGVLGLGSSPSITSFVSRLVSSYKIPFKVALCLPSKPGNGFGSVYIGGGPYLLPPNRKNVTSLLVSTPLIPIAETREFGEYHYFIEVKSIEVNGKRLSFNQNLLIYNKTIFRGCTKISSNVIPYTLLETSIYKALVKAFAGKAEKQKAVYPFTDCFSYKSFGGKSLLGKETPVISLVLGGGAKWDIYGPNSLVKVKNNTVLCFAFQDAGDNPTFPIEIGGYQMEDNLVEFDLEASKFSITSSLLPRNTSCGPM